WRAAPSSSVRRRWSTRSSAPSGAWLAEHLRERAALGGRGRQLQQRHERRRDVPAGDRAQGEAALHAAAGGNEQPAVVRLGRTLAVGASVARRPRVLLAA